MKKMTFGIIQKYSSPTTLRVTFFLYTKNHEKLLFAVICQSRCMYVLNEEQERLRDHLNILKQILCQKVNSFRNKRNRLSILWL